jgi:hypothetical protein
MEKKASAEKAVREIRRGNLGDSRYGGAYLVSLDGVGCEASRTRKASANRRESAGPVQA